MSTLAARPGAHRDLAAGFWRLASPKISLASFSSLALGGAIAHRLGGVEWGWYALAVLGIFLLEIAKNASGDIFDLATDLQVAEADRSPFSGGKRVLVDGLLTVRDTWTIAIAGYAGGAAIGFTIAFVHAPEILWLGVAGLGVAFVYNGPPLRLVSRGLGELAVGLAYGPMICTGTLLALSHTPPLWAVLAAVPLGMLIAAFLVANEFPDFRADRASGKRTLVVRLGRPGGARFFAGLIAVTFAAIAALPLAGAPIGVLLGLLALAPAGKAARDLLRAPEDMRVVVPSQALTLISFLVYAVAASLGVLVLR